MLNATSASAGARIEPSISVCFQFQSTTSEEIRADLEDRCPIAPFLPAVSPAEDETVTISSLMCVPYSVEGQRDRAAARAESNTNTIMVMASNSYPAGRRGEAL